MVNTITTMITKETSLQAPNRIRACIRKATSPCLWTTYSFMKLERSGIRDMFAKHTEISDEKLINASSSF